MRLISQNNNKLCRLMFQKYVLKLIHIIYFAKLWNAFSKENAVVTLSYILLMYWYTFSKNCCRYKRKLKIFHKRKKPVN